MSANFSEIFTAYPVVRTREASTPFPSERRKRPRIQVHWPVLLFRNHAADAVVSTTLNLTSIGFYCLSAVPFAPGETLMCTLKVPVHDPSGKHFDRNLECRVRVLRVDTQSSEGKFGLACQIDDYHLADLITNA
jgi:hypothetical protein